MKYIVSVYYNEKEYTATASVRSDAKWKTVAIKCISAIVEVLKREKIIANNRIEYGIDPPNVWTNGAFASAWIIKPFMDIYAIREDGSVFL